MTFLELGNLGGHGRVTPHARRAQSWVALTLVALVSGGCGSDGTGENPAMTPGMQPGPAAPSGGSAGSVGAPPAAPSAGGSPTGGTSAAMPPQNTGVPAAGGGAAQPPSPQMPVNPPPTAPPMTMPTPPTQVQPPVEMGTPTLFWLDIAAGVVTTAKADGSGAKRFASGSPLSAPDGVTVDPMGGHVFVLNMGSLLGGANNGSLVRYKLDGSSPEVIMKPGAMADGQRFNTGKQVTIDKVNRKLYMGDREGSKVWRCDLDGQNLEVLVSGHDIKQVVGVAADPTKGHFYFSDRNGKKLFRANMQMPAGKTHADRDDLELLYVDQASNAMPLDLELDLKERRIYWTDRDQNIVFGMSMDIPAGQDPMTRTDVKEIATGLVDVIGLAFDHETSTLYVTHSGSVSSFKTDGTGVKRIGSGGSTGIAFARIP